MLVGLCVLAAWVCGCQPTVPKAKFDRLNQTWLDCLKENRDLSRRYRQMEDTVGRQNEQIATLQHLGDKRLEKLYYVVSVELGRRCGGVDTDHQDGDDGIMVYLRPVDRDGHVIKAAGEATVQLYDLASKPAENLIGEYHWSVDELGQTWGGGFFGSSQFSLLCPWRLGLPKHNQITVRLSFTDYLTGRTFTAQKLVTVHLPGAPRVEPSGPPRPPQSAPATQPATVPALQESD